jgi:hypothetical protein
MAMIRSVASRVRPGDALTIALAGQQMRDLPVDKRHVLGYHVSETGGFELGRGCSQNICVRDDDLRAFCRIGDLEIAVHNGRAVGGESVHAGSRGKEAERLFPVRAGQTAGIMYRAGADRQNAVHAIEIAFDHSYVVHRGNANRLIDILGHAETVQTVQDSFRGAKRVFIGDQQQALRKMVLLQDLSHLMDEPAPDLDVLDGRIRASARRGSPENLRSAS